ncbi:MAG: ABC transporter substrate-binding protein [Synergistales bacterium]|nr:ABC transporter substrate-binding protein [Synergistales bacterium]
MDHLRTGLLVALAALVASALAVGASTGGDVASPAPESAGRTERTAPPDYARGFTVSERDGTTLLTVPHPWKGGPEQRYLLVPRDKPLPDIDVQDATVVRTPPTRVVSLSTLYTAALHRLGVADRIVGQADTNLLYNSELRNRVQRGEIDSVGPSSSIQPEPIMALEPDVVFAYAVGDAAYDTLRRIRATGVPVVLLAGYLEQHPLGRAEWLRFLGYFFGKEEAAGQHIRRIAARYTTLSRRANREGEAPSVLANIPYQGTWYAPGGGSYLAHLLTDAGALYPWRDTPSAGSLPLTFEAVYEKALGTDFWVHVGSFRSISGLLDTDPRYGRFRAVREGRVYNNDARIGPGGGNDFYESGFLHPERILADLVTIFHPELLPHRDLFYYRQLPREDDD